MPISLIWQPGTVWVSRLYSNPLGDDMKSWLTPRFILNHAALPQNHMLYPNNRYPTQPINQNGICNFIEPLFLILKAALQDSIPDIIIMQAPPTEWRWLIGNRKWQLLPFLFAAMRYLNQYEVAHRNNGEIARGLKVFKVSPLLNRIIPYKVLLF